MSQDCLPRILWRAGPKRLHPLPPAAQKLEPSAAVTGGDALPGESKKSNPLVNRFPWPWGARASKQSVSNSEGGKNRKPFCNSGTEARTLKPAGDLTAKGFTFFARRPGTNLVLEKLVLLT